MKKLAERTNGVCISPQNCYRITDHTLDAAQLLGAVGHVRNLMLGDIGGVPREAGKKHHNRLHQLLAAAGRENDWIDLEVTRRRECKRIKTCESQHTVN